LENGSATGTTTIDQGYFEIMNVPETGFITASFIGYKPITLSYRNTTRNINFELPLEVNQISEVEILGTKPLEKKTKPLFNSSYIGVLACIAHLYSLPPIF